MPLRRAQSSFSTGLQIILQPGQDLLVAEGVWVQSTDTHAIGSRIGGQTIRIAGTVQAAYDAVRFGNLLDGEASLGASGRLTMIIERTGQLLSEQDSSVQLSVEAVDLVNRGRIVGDAGFSFDTDYVPTVRDRAASSLVNSGLILAYGSSAVSVKSEAAFLLVNTGKIVAMDSEDAIIMSALSRFSLRNDGFIYGDISIGAKGRFTNNGTLMLPDDGVSLGSNVGAVTFVNTGRVLTPSGAAATVQLSDFADLYDGFRGVFHGTISGSGGNDRFIPGRGAETIDAAPGQGLSEIDTLDFRQSIGVRVDIENPAFNRGVAAGDSYADMDIILGSLRGADFIIGGQYAERLVGNGGADTLIGGASNDTLHGGLGRDRVSGGIGDDAFLFRSPAERGDVIVDFSNTGQDDVLRIDARGFGLTALASGPLAAARLRIGATNQAGDANDRFIFDTRNDSLWFDRDGKGDRFDPVLIARFLGDPSFGAADIYILG